jgi:hypothetical protein
MNATRMPLREVLHINRGPTPTGVPGPGEPPFLPSASALGPPARRPLEGPCPPGMPGPLLVAQG